MNTPPPSHEPGLETRLLQAWPWALAGGTVVPLLLAGVVWWLGPASPDVAAHKQQLLAWFTLIGIVIFYWTMVATVATGCWVVRVMKGPVQTADSYPFPERDRFAA